jgi:hypothetical protein
MCTQYKYFIPESAGMSMLLSLYAKFHVSNFAVFRQQISSSAIVVRSASCYCTLDEIELSTSCILLVEDLLQHNTSES